ncbi:unnamed protein product [Lactuca virosa]|uniref:Myb/SANT-like domain-containing protein n=1 Tax=Lactuca virosa TaxID=75947 RepID=A0AAU9P8N8_9ASTR|nr:unnamed protein product [Lactuca virosa]
MDENHTTIVDCETSLKMKKPKFGWDNRSFMVFVDSCLIEQKKGHKPGTSFDKFGWENIQKRIKEKTGYNLEKKQLTNKWENMKKEWKLYDRLMRLETGLGGTRSLLDASPEWMDSDDSNSSNDNEECEMEEYIEFEMLCGLALQGIILARNLRTPCHTSDRTGHMFITEVLNGHPRRCYEMFRLNVPVFRQLCIDLATNYGLQQTRKVSIEESVGIFLMTLAHGCSNRFVQEFFNHSGETIHMHFHIVLKAVLKLSADIIKPDANYNDDVLEYILNKPRYYPMFKGKTRRKHEKWEGFDGSATIGRVAVVRGRRRRLARPGKKGERRLAAANPEALNDREEGEETKAARPSLSRLVISDRSHSSGELRWSTRPKKDVGRSNDAAVGLAYVLNPIFLMLQTNNFFFVYLN